MSSRKFKGQRNHRGRWLAEVGAGADITNRRRRKFPARAKVTQMASDVRVLDPVTGEVRKVIPYRSRRG